MAVGLRQVNQTATITSNSARATLFMIVGSSGYFEISAGQASAAKILGVGRGRAARADDISNSS